MATELPDAGDGAALAGLRDALERAGFTAERIEERLGTHELSSRPLDTAVHLRRLAEDDAFATLARLFLLGAPVGTERVEAAVSPLGVAGLASLRLVAVDGGEVRSLVRLVPHGDYHVASDAGQESGADVPFDHVPGIQAPSVTLAKLAVRTHCGSALDLGTGCGIRARRRNRRQPARAAVCGVQRRAERDRDDRVPGGRRVRARRGRALRPHRRESAVRDLARQLLRLPRQRSAR
jgi:hypothetical protein